MVLDNYRRSLDWWLLPLSRSLRAVHPDVFTWLALAFALAGGVLFKLSDATTTGLGFLMAAFACVVLNGVFDLLDGQVAKLSGRASPRGDFLDHSIDRFSDAAFLVGIGLSGWVRSGIAVAAVAATLLASYMGTQAQAVGLKRHYGGILGRADRMVLLMAAPLAQWLYTGVAQRPHMHIAGWPTSFLELALLYFAVMGSITTVQRFVASLRGFGPDGQLR